jgi:hypothetical protein
LFIGRGICMDTSESLSSDAWVKTGVVIGIFSDEAFLPNMYLQVQPYMHFQQYNICGYIFQVMVKKELTQ